MTNLDNKLEKMTKEELIGLIKKKALKLKQYQRKYVASKKGKISLKEASKRYYLKNKDEILEKKRQKYFDLKNSQKK